MADEKTYGVFVHSSGRDGGYVVRTVFNGWTPSPYSTEQALRIFKREASAQRDADKRNAA
jgi:hypothetical protein